MLFRIFNNSPLELIKIQGEEFYYLKKVLKLGKEDRFEVIDGRSNIYVYKIDDIYKDSLSARIVEKYSYQEKKAKEITIIQALTKNEKLELVLQKATEIGVSEFIIYQADRSKNKLSKIEKKQERWQKIIISAVCQSRQVQIPAIQVAKDLEQALLLISGQVKIYYADTGECGQYLSQINDKQLGLVFGPESGFSSDERQLLSSKASQISLGSNILRTETAPVAAAAKLLLP